MGRTSNHGSTPGGPRKGIPWAICPDMHDEVTELLDEDNLSFDFNNIDDDQTCVRYYDTHIMGRFACHNQGCSSPGWGSRMIPITIRLYPGGRYNARVYHQRCRGCKRLSRPVLDKACYAERVAYRLKKWAGVEVEPPTFQVKNGPPHQSDLCEGCKAGHCREMNVENISDGLTRLQL